MLDAWRKFRSFPAAKRRLFYEAAVALVQYRVGVRFFSVQRYLDELDAKPGKTDGKPDENQQPLVDDIAWAVASAANHLPGQYVCLPRALAAMRLLARRKIPCTFHLGATMIEEKMKAHAWLSCGGRIITGERGAGEYQELGVFSIHSPSDQPATRPLEPIPTRAVPEESS